MTSGHRDSLMSQMTILEDLSDLEATVIDTYVTALKESSDPETLTLIEVETTASKEFATTTETTIKAATMVVKTVSDKLDEKAAQDQGCISCGTCSYLELTVDRVLTSAYVKFFGIITRNAVNKSF